MTYQCSECALTYSGTGPTCEQCLSNMPAKETPPFPVWIQHVWPRKSQLESWPRRFSSCETQESPTFAAQWNGTTPRIDDTVSWQAIREFVFGGKLYEQEPPDKIAADTSLKVVLR